MNLDNFDNNLVDIVIVGDVNQKILIFLIESLI